MTAAATATPWRAFVVVAIGVFLLVLNSSVSEEVAKSRRRVRKAMFTGKAHRVGAVGIGGGPSQPQPRSRSAQEVLSVTSQATGQVWVYRLGGAAAVVGSLVAMVGNLLHPMTPVGDPAGVAQAIHDSDAWTAIHLTIVIGLILMLAGLVAIADSIRGPLAAAMARFGYVAALSGVTLGLILVTLDGIAAKQLADAWAEAPSAQQAAALRDLVAEETMNFALVALFNILFAGATFILYGLAVAFSDVYPRWLGWPVVVAGIGSVAVGLVQAQVGESTGISRIASIVFPTIITLWVAVLGILLMRRATDLATPAIAEGGKQ